MILCVYILILIYKYTHTNTLYTNRPTCIPYRLTAYILSEVAI